MRVMRGTSQIEDLSLQVRPTDTCYALTFPYCLLLCKTGQLTHMHVHRHTPQ